MADVVIAVGGGAGTLSEIALAWQHQKPVIALDTGSGWSTRLAGSCSIIDARMWCTGQPMLRWQSPSPSNSTVPEETINMGSSETRQLSRRLQWTLDWQTRNMVPLMKEPDSSAVSSASGPRPDDSRRC